MLQKPRPADLPVRHRRRPPFLPATGPLVAPRSTATPPPSRRTTALRSLFALVPLALLAYIFHTLLHRAPSGNTVNSPAPNKLQVEFPASDDETAVSRYRLQPSTANTAAAHGGVIACMPTVSRGNGSVEYVSNAVKSWYLAHSGSPPPLHVYAMDEERVGRDWLEKIGAVGPWLQVKRFRTAQKRARKLTFRDSAERVAWRSKEALDYAAVLRDCAKNAVAGNESAEIVLLVQDDVLFVGDAFPGAAEWARNALRDGARTRVNRQGVTVPVRVCSASLFDIGGNGRDFLVNSNLVARVWRVKDAQRVAAYFETRFDDAPVDWLADLWCRKHHAVVDVLRPNPVRHRGRVSSFAGNDREGLLT